MLVALLSAGLFAERTSAFRGEALSPALPAAEIEMTDASGNAFQLSALRGKVVLLYFGFVNCPEECPLTLAHYKQALTLLGADAQDVQVVLVSTDPLRDTPQALQEYLSRFDPAFIGIPGSPEQLEKVWQDFDVTVLEGGETHSSFTYVVDREGMIRLHFTPEPSAEDIASDLKILLSEN
jgi:protein SCO1/2